MFVVIILKGGIIELGEEGFNEEEFRQKVGAMIQDLPKDLQDEVHKEMEEHLRLRRSGRFIPPLENYDRIFLKNYVEGVINDHRLIKSLAQCISR